MAKRNLSLYQQALIEERKQSLPDKSKISAGMDMSEILEILLPNYDQDKETGKARRWHQSDKETKIIKGGVRSGKTYALMAEAIGLSYVNRPLPHLSLSPGFGLAKRTVVKVLEDHCKKNALSYDWVSTEQEFRIYHGNSKDDTSTIIVIGADQGIKGMTVASGDVNEPFTIKRDRYLIWEERISDHSAVILRKLLGGTAEPAKMNWGHEYFKHERFETDELYADTITTYENAMYLPPKYIQRLEAKYTPREREVYLLGKNLNLATTSAYYEFKHERNVQKHEDIMRVIARQTQKLTILLGFDFNYNPMTCCEYVIVGDKRYQVGEYKISGSNTAELCDVVINRLNHTYPRLKEDWSLLITGDASGRKHSTSAMTGDTDIDIISKKFYKAGLEPVISFDDSNPPVRDRVNYTNKLLETARYIISDRCEHTIKDRELVTWKEGTDGFKIDKSKTDLTHLSDAGDYALGLTKRMGIDTVDDDDMPADEILTGDERHSKRW